MREREHITLLRKSQTGENCVNIHGLRPDIGFGSLKRV
jgi:hypothetical protein